MSPEMKILEGAGDRRLPLAEALELVRYGHALADETEARSRTGRVVLEHVVAGLLEVFRAGSWDALPVWGVRAALLDEASWGPGGLELWTTKAGYLG